MATCPAVHADVVDAVAASTTVREFLLNTLYTPPAQSVMGFAIIAAGLPFYSYWTRRRSERVEHLSAEPAGAITVQRRQGDLSTSGHQGVWCRVSRMLVRRP